MSDLFIRNLTEHLSLFRTLEAVDGTVQQAGQLMAAALQGGHKLLFCGNGGSAADSQHLASELTGRFIKDRRPLAASGPVHRQFRALTCIGNDYAFEEVFARQVGGLGAPGGCAGGDFHIGQRSRNVLRAVEEARSIAGMPVIGLLGRDGGVIARRCAMCRWWCQAQVTARIQEAHILIGHTLCGLIEEIAGFGLRCAHGKE
jgi:D-sedoheptulose 7-phosphate isomerase